MQGYYYLGTFLPPLEFPSMPDIDFMNLKTVLEMNVSKKDFEEFRKLCLFVDLLNIRAILQEESIDPKGNFGERQLDDALIDQTGFPQYVFDFLQAHKTLDEKLSHFPQLLVQFFRDMAETSSGFLREFFIFEREWRLVVLALRAKSLHRNLLKELQFEDLSDFLVRQILVQKEAQSYDPPMEYKEIKELLQSSGNDPIEQNKVLTLYRFKKVKNMCEAKPFSMDWILAYAACLMMIEYYNELDQVKGQMILDTFKTT